MSSAAERDDFDPYRVWLGIPKSEQPANHYRLLGITVFEEDPQVILEGADRQVAHLKTKQTGQRVALSQKLLQQVASAAGCLLDPDEKAKYDAELRESLAPEPVERGEEAPAELPPRYQPPVYHQPAPVPYYPPAPSPLVAGYPQPLPPALAPMPPAPMRPIPVPIKAVEPAAEEPPTQFVAPSFGPRSTYAGRAKDPSADVMKLAIAGGAAVLLLFVAWIVIKSSGLTENQPAPVAVKHGVKPKPAIKPAPVSPAPITPVKPAVPADPKPMPATKAADKVPTEEPVTNETPTTPSTPAPPITPTPIVPTSTTPTPPLTPTPSPSVPAPAVPAKTPEKKLWRYAGGFIELTADGSWRELSPTGDYFTLTPATSLNPSRGPADVMEFERTTGGRLRVYDNRLELSSALSSSMFTEVAKGSWGPPAEELELDAQHTAMLQRACHLYAEALAKARRKLLAQFDDAMSVSRKRVGKADEQLAVIEVLTAEKKRFEETGLVPWSVPMQADTVKYLAEIHQARGPSEALFERAMKDLVTKKNHEAAASVQALKNKALAPLVIAKISLTDVPRTPPRPFGGFPKRRDDNDLPDDDASFTDDPRTGIVRLWSNTAVNNASGKSNWSLGGGNLLLQFARPAYTVRETIVIADRGDELSGKAVFSNTFSLNFTGKFLDTLEPHERRPEVKFVAAE